LQTAHLEAENRELALQDVRNRLAGLVREKLETFQKRIELVELEVHNVAAAEQNLRLQQDRYQIGTSSSLEFRDAQVNLIRAQSVLITAGYQARITRLEIEQLTGSLSIK
jgi:outer membrane protein TolC